MLKLEWLKGNTFENEKLKEKGVPSWMKAIESNWNDQYIIKFTTSKLAFNSPTPLTVRDWIEASRQTSDWKLKSQCLVVVLSKLNLNWTSMKEIRNSSVELRLFVTQCCYSTINSKFPPEKFLQSRHWNEASNDFKFIVQNTQQINWECLANVQWYCRSFSCFSFPALWMWDWTSAKNLIWTWMMWLVLVDDVKGSQRVVGREHKRAF